MQKDNSKHNFLTFFSQSQIISDSVMSSSSSVQIVYVQLS